MPLEVEPDVAEVRLGKEPEAALLLVGEEVDSGARRSRGSGAGARPGGGPPRASPCRMPVDREPVRRLAAERRQRRNPGSVSVSACAPPQPCDEDEVVVVSQLLLAELAEVADPAVVDTASGRSRARSSSAPRKRSRDAAEVGDVLGECGTSRARRVPSSTWKRSGRLPLDPPELLGVEAELQHVRRLGAERASFVSTGLVACRPACRSRKSANPRQVPSVRYGW